MKIEARDLEEKKNKEGTLLFSHWTYYKFTVPNQGNNGTKSTQAHHMEHKVLKKTLRNI